MNYQKIYDDICKRGQTRIIEKGIYSEKHHIIPKCLGGLNDKSNLTRLTAREHFLVHYILAFKLYKNHKGIAFALHKMCSINNNQQRFRPASKIYEEIRIKLCILSKGRIVSAETKTKMHETRKMPERNSMFGKKHTLETLKKMSEAKKGKIFSEETRKKMSEAKKNPTDETRKKLSEAARKRTGEKHPSWGLKRSQESRMKMSLAHIGNKSNNSIRVLDIKTNIMYDSIRIATTDLNVSRFKIKNDVRFKLIKNQ